MTVPGIPSGCAFLVRHDTRSAICRPAQIVSPPPAPGSWPARHSMKSPFPNFKMWILLCQHSLPALRFMDNEKSKPATDAKQELSLALPERLQVCHLGGVAARCRGREGVLVGRCGR